MLRYTLANGDGTFFELVKFFTINVLSKSMEGLIYCGIFMVSKYIPCYDSRIVCQFYPCVMKQTYDNPNGHGQTT